MWLCMCVQIRLCPYSNNHTQIVPQRSVDGVYNSSFRNSALPGGGGGCKHAFACRIQDRINAGETTVQELEREFSLYLMNRFDVHRMICIPAISEAYTTLMCNVNLLTNFAPNSYCRERTKPAGSKDKVLYAGGSVANWNRTVYVRQRERLDNGGLSQVAEATPVAPPKSTRHVHLDDQG